MPMASLAFTKPLYTMTLMCTRVETLATIVEGDGNADGEVAFAFLCAGRFESLESYCADDCTDETDDFPEGAQPPPLPARFEGET